MPRFHRCRCYTSGVRPTITVTIIAGNEEERIEAAVRSAGWADEVLVLDSESVDNTAGVAEGAGARVVVEGWRGYGAQKNRAADLATHDWVFSLDADERLTDKLVAGIEAVGSRPREAAFAVRRRNHVAGRPIRRWPWSWDSCRRLYDRRRARFSERAVHESLETEGAIGLLPGHLEHLTYRDEADLRERQHRYARLGAEDMRQRGRRPKIGDVAVRPLVTFLRHWVARGYLLGGAQGWRLSWIAARGTRLKYRILRELDRGA